MKAALLLLGSALALALAGCVDRPSLVDPAPPPAPPRPVLPAGELAIYESDTVRVPVAGQPGGAGAQVQLLLLDSTRAVRWRSPAAGVNGEYAAVPVDGVPAAVTRGAAVLATAVLLTGDGGRSYASDDSLPARRLADAATRTLRVWAGRRVRAGDGTVPPDLAVGADVEHAFFPIPSLGAVGVLDLHGEGAVGGTYPAGVRPERVAYRAGVLAVLGAGGGQVGFLQVTAAGLTAPSTRLLAPLEVEVDTTFLGAVRPTGRGLALGCPAPDCTTPFAAIPSAMQPLVGSGARSGAEGALRLIAAVPPVGGEPALPPLVLPAYSDALRGDTSADVGVFTPAAPDGARTALQRGIGASACLATALGGPHVAAGADGVVFVADDGQAEPACGPGTTVLRIDHAAGPRATVSALAVRSSQADERIAGVLGLQLAEDGSALLIVSAGGVTVADPFLRIRGTLALQGIRSAAWLHGGGEARFAVADAGGVTVFDALRLTQVARIPVGPTAGPMVYLHRAGGPDLVAASIPGGFVVAPVPAR